MTFFRSGARDPSALKGWSMVVLAAAVYLSSGTALLVLLVEALPVQALQESIGSIAFVSSRDGNAEIYLLDVDRGYLRRVTHHPADDLRPSWSPDGRRIAFYSNRTETWDVFVMTASGLQVRQISEGKGRSGNPSWSPDGRRIAFDSTLSGSLEIYTVEATCLDSPLPCAPQRLTFHAGPDQSPSWSPDSQRLVFESIRTGFDERRMLFVADASCFTPPCGAKERPLSTGHLSDSWPSWSPNGLQIAFESINEQRRSIYAVDANCFTRPRGCTASARLLVEHLESAQQPAWSPDGHFLVFTAWVEGNMDIYLLDLRCAESDICAQPTRRLTEHPGDDFSAAWWP